MLAYCGKTCRACSFKVSRETAFESTSIFQVRPGKDENPVSALAFIDMSWPDFLVHSRNTIECTIVDYYSSWVSFWEAVSLHYEYTNLETI